MLPTLFFYLLLSSSVFFSPPPPPHFELPLCSPVCFLFFFWQTPGVWTYVLLLPDFLLLLLLLFHNINPTTLSWTAFYVFCFCFLPAFLVLCWLSKWGHAFHINSSPPPSFSQARISITFHWGKRQKQRLCTGSTSLWHVLLIELASGAANPLFAADLYRLSLTAFCFRFTSLNSTFSSLSLFFFFFQNIAFHRPFFFKAIYSFCYLHILQSRDYLLLFSSIVLKRQNRPYFSFSFLSPYRGIDVR